MDDVRSPSLPDVTPPSSAPAVPAPVIECRPVRSASELAEHLSIRRAVFVAEQGLFEVDDHDEHDDDPSTIHILGFEDGLAAGTVRIFSTPSADEPDLWKGDRLAVRSGHRKSGLGGPLVKRAVALAGSAGGSRMVAWVQVANTRFFEHLGWSTVGEPELYFGQPHQQMTIDLV
jgi:putative N-acetyltransferase (TIGR04045 family)